MKKMTHRKITIIRHGSTALNENDKIRGWLDVPLSPLGEKQVAALAKKLKGSSIDGLVSSDLIRAQKTSKVISKETGIPILAVTQAMRPWDLGKFSGQESKKIHDQLADYANSPDKKVPGGESLNDFKGRLFGGLAQVIHKYKGNIGIVTHHRVDRLVDSYIKAGQPADFSIHMPTFLKHGRSPATAREVSLKTAHLLIKYKHRKEKHGN